MSGRVTLLAEARAISGRYVATCHLSEYEHLLEVGLLRKVTPYLRGEEKLVLVAPDELTDPARR